MTPFSDLSHPSPIHEWKEGLGIFKSMTTGPLGHQHPIWIQSLALGGSSLPDISTGNAGDGTAVGGDQVQGY